MIFQSTVLLRWIVYFGFLLASLGVALAAYTFIVFLVGRPLPNWTALPMLTLLLAGFIIVSGGVTGLYVGKIFDQVKGRPLYVIDVKVVNGVERSVARDLGEPLETDGDLRAIKAAVREDGSCLNDRELLRRFAEEGNQDAFAALVRRHSDLVFGACRRAFRFAPPRE